MKKLLIFLLILALFLTGCSTPPTDDGTTPPTVDDENETNDSKQDGGELFKPNDTQSDESTEKVPTTQTLTVWKPQDESDDFLFDFELIEGSFVRGKTIRLNINVYSNMETIFTAYDSFIPKAELICVMDGEEYIIEPREKHVFPEFYSMEVRPGAKNGSVEYFDIPFDAPMGEYILVCSYNDTTIGFEGYFTLTQ